MWKLLQDLLSAIRLLTVELQFTRAELAHTRTSLRGNSDALIANAKLLLQLQPELAELVQLLRFPPNPGAIRLVVTGQEGPMLQFEIDLPELPSDPGLAAQIVSGELMYKIADADSVTVPVAKDAASVPGLQGNAGDHVSAALVYLDAAGNRSLHPSLFEGDLVDTIPPPDAGSLGIKVVGEV
jgi:hypothetical protein